tara:strand:+ start:290 stop:412 length:123 start_codon:yes stop_codon:yes gene_type:complete
MNKKEKKIKWLENIIDFHHQLGNKGLEQAFKMKLNKIKNK